MKDYRRGSFDFQVIASTSACGIWDSLQQPQILTHPHMQHQFESGALLTKIIIDSFHIIWKRCFDCHFQRQVLPQHIDQQELIRLQGPLFHTFLDVLNRALLLRVIPDQHLLPWLLLFVRLKDNLHIETSFEQNWAM